MLNTICDICGNGDNNVFHVAREMMFGYREEFDYLECVECGCVQSKAKIDDFSKYYGDAYYSMKSSRSPRRPIYEAIKALRTRAFLGNSNFLGDYLLKIFGPPGLPNWVRRSGISQKSSILEVGCGSGRLLMLLASEGFINLSGADPFIEKDQRPLPGVTIKKAEVDEVEGCFDCIVLEHSFEHIPNPHDTLHRLSCLLANDGVLIISIPVAAQAWKQYGVNWVQLDAPRHLYLHSEKSFRLLCKEMEIVEVVYDSSEFQFWGSEQYLMNIPLLDPGSYRKDKLKSSFSDQQITEFRRQAIRLNEIGQGDQATFYIKKRSH